MTAAALVCAILVIVPSSAFQPSLFGQLTAGRVR